MTFSYSDGAGALTKFAIGPGPSSAQTSNNWTTSTCANVTRMDLLDFQPNIVKVLSDGSVKAIRGTLDHQQLSVAQGILHVRFRTKMYLTATKMNTLLPLLGFNTSTSSPVAGTAYVWTLGDPLPAQGTNVCNPATIIMAPPGANEDIYYNCYPSDWVIEGQKGADPITIDIGWVGQQWYQQTGATFFTSATTPPLVEGYTYPFATTGTGNSAAVTIGSGLAGSGSVTLEMPMVRLSCDYKLAVEFLNSLTATNIVPTDHELKIGTSALYPIVDATTNATYLWNGVNGPMTGDVSGASFAWNLERATVSGGASFDQTQFSVANIKSIARSFVFKKHDLVRLPLQFEGYASGSTALLQITNEFQTNF